MAELPAGWLNDSLLLIFVQKPPNTTEGLAKAWEKILKEKKDKTQN